MESKQFDLLARNLSADGAGRRQILRALASAALGAMVARIGLPDVSEAKTTHHQAGQETKHTSQAKRKKQGSLHDEGKGKGKKRHKKGKDPKSPPPLSPLPPGCQNCNACQMCQNGACVADPALDGVTCLGSGSGCSYCKNGQCAVDPERKCADGSCPGYGQCCEKERKCPGEEGCKPMNVCCDGTKPCGENTCIPENRCCDQDPDPTCDSCSRPTCILGHKVCTGGCQGDGQVCCGGTCLNRPCNNGCDISDDCSRCNKAPSGKFYCAGQDRCVDRSCPPDKQFDETLCRCIQVQCPNATKTCPIDFSSNGCGGDRQQGEICNCLKSTSGDIHCVNQLSRVWATCTEDSQCDQFYGAGNGMCASCQWLCYKKNSCTHMS